MTQELSVAVRLKADGSGLVGQVNQAKQAVGELGRETASAGGQAKVMATGTAEAGRAANDLAQSASRTVSATRELVGEQRQATRVAEQLTGAQRTQARALNDNYRSAGQIKAGYFQLGQQIQDVGVQISTGTDLMRVAALQGGQLATAITMIGPAGVGGTVARFFAGPWGAAILTAGAVLVPLISALSDTEDAAKSVGAASDSLATAQGALGEIFDLVTGKLKNNTSALAENNEMMRVNAQLAVNQLRREAAQERLSSTKALDNSSNVSLGTQAKDFLAGFQSGTGGRNPISNDVDDAQRRAGQLAGVVRGMRDGRLKPEDVLQYTQRFDFSGLKVSREEFQTAVRDTVSSGLKDRLADLTQKALDTGVLDNGLRREGPKKREKKPKSTEARDEFGRDAADKIAGIVGQFDDAPGVIDKTNAKIRELDDLIEDLGRKKPPGFEGLIAEAERAKVTVREGLIREVAKAFEQPKTLADKATVAIGQIDAAIADLQKNKPVGFEQVIAGAEAAKTVIREGLNKPFNDFVQAQNESYQIGQLIVSGRFAEAEAMRAVLQLEREMGPLNEEQRQAVFATAEGLAAQERQLERLQRRQAVYLDGLRDIQGIVRQTIYEGPTSLTKLPERLLDSFRRTMTEQISENLFGSLFEQLEDQVKGVDIVENASNRMSEAVGAMTRQTGQAGAALDQLARSATNAVGSLNARSAGGTVSNGFGLTRDAAGRPATDVLAQADAFAARIDRSIADGTPIDGSEVVVRGERPEKKLSVQDLYGSAIGGVAEKTLKLFTNQDTAKAIGDSIGRFSGKALGGAFEGQAAASVAGMLGIKTSGTGAAIGGAIGNFLPIPGGSIIGGLVGGVVGNLFKSTKSGSATISDATTDATTGGNSKDFQKVASGLAGSVQDTLAQIAEQLGGTLGSFGNITIGKRGDDFRVNTGGTSLKTKKGAKDFNDDEGAAIAYAVRVALERGAVDGLSSAVQRALQSSDDVNKALNEALKVGQLERMLGGVTGQLNAIFRDFDRTAAERVSIAKKYGLDLLAVEKLNGEQRADLLKDTLNSRVGSLKDLLANLKFGDLFEGDAATRRSRLMQEIADAQNDADKGVEGAANRVAELYRQLTTTSRDAFGTAGPEYAADRDAAIAGVERVIQIETDRVNAAAAAQQATTAAVVQGNALAIEANQHLAKINEALRTLGQGGGFAGQQLGGANLALVARGLLDPR